jgi:hypothetical protein
MVPTIAVSYAQVFVSVLRYSRKNVPTKSSRTGRIILLALLAEALSPAEDVMLPEPERVAAVG